jgi:hypothetical protein
MAKLTVLQHYEVVDRTAQLMHNLEQAIQGHPVVSANEVLKQKLQSAVDAMHDLYSEAHKVMDEFETNNP